MEEPEDRRRDPLRQAVGESATLLDWLGRSGGTRSAFSQSEQLTRNLHGNLTKLLEQKACPPSAARLMAELWMAFPMLRHVGLWPARTPQQPSLVDRLVARFRRLPTELEPVERPRFVDHGVTLEQGGALVFALAAFISEASAKAGDEG